MSEDKAQLYNWEVLLVEQTPPSLTPDPPDVFTVMGGTWTSQDNKQDLVVAEEWAEHEGSLWFFVGDDRVACYAKDRWIRVKRLNPMKERPNVSG
jgi:hypothetical protein